MRSIKQDALIYLLVVLCAVGFMVIFLTQQRNYYAGKINQTYLKANACVISVSPTVRTGEYVKTCYQNAIKETGVHVELYGNAK